MRTGFRKRPRAKAKKPGLSHRQAAPKQGPPAAKVEEPMATLPTRMTAIGIKAPGGPEVLVPEQRPVPTPATDEILVKVAAAGVNRPDVMQRQGLYPPPPGAPDIPGLEIAGEVVALGSGVKRWKVGCLLYTS